MRRLTCAVSCAIALALVLGAGLANASTQWSVTADQDTIYVVKYDGGTPTTAPVPASHISGASFAGIAVWGDYVLVADNSTQALLRVGRLESMNGTPRVEWLNTVDLQLPGTSTYLTNPTAIAVNSDGGVYVLGNSGQLSNYAYIPYLGGWSATNLAIANVTDGYFRDVDAGGLDMAATIALKGYTSDRTLVTTAFGGSVLVAAETGDGGNQPRAVAEGTNGLSYLANWMTADQDGFVDVPGSISVINSILGSQGIFQLPGFQPNDISFFTRDGANYLGVVGITSGGINQAWRLTLDGAGLPVLDASVLKWTLSSTFYSNTQRCAVSEDGTTFWVTDPGWSAVTAIDTGNEWLGHQIILTGSPIYVGAYVPEPGSLVALLTGVVGLIGLRRRRR